MKGDSVRRGGSFVAQEAHSEENFSLEPRAHGNVPSVYSLQSVYAIQVAQSSGGLGTAWEIWKQRKWLAIFIFLPVFTAVMSVTLLLPAVYQSTAIILIERRQVP